MAKKKAVSRIREIRNKTGLNQQEFWGRIGVTQSGGSRYESGRSIPTPTKSVLTIAYGTEEEAAAAVLALRQPVSVAVAEPT